MPNIEIKMLQGGSNTIYDIDFMRCVGTQHRCSSIYCIFTRIFGWVLLHFGVTHIAHKIEMEKWSEFTIDLSICRFFQYRKRRTRKRVDREIHRNRDNVVLIELRT